MTCRTCDGRGLVRTPTRRYDTTGYGDCPNCVANDQCPVCDAQDSGAIDGRCWNCGWVWDDHTNYERWSLIPQYDNETYDKAMQGAKIS